jgi:3-phenylpropionate/trans-cinnamate dioxygenase ferredoxin subunit
VTVGDVVTVGRVEDVPVGEARAFDAGTTAVAVARTDEGWYAFDDTCTHMGCSLAEGEIEGGAVVCACHGSEFELATGEVLNGPADEPVHTYEVTVEGDEIKVIL